MVTRKCKLIFTSSSPPRRPGTRSAAMRRNIQNFHRNAGKNDLTSVPSGPRRPRGRYLRSIIARNSSRWHPVYPSILQGVNMHKSTKFWNRIADRYSKQPVADESAYQKKLQVTQEYFHPDMKVLEIGCGTGSTSIVHAPFVKHIVAIDLSSRMIEIARDKADAASIENVVFECLAIDELNVGGRNFGAVLGLSILHLLDNKTEVIDRVFQMLEPNGVFITSTSCIGDTMKFFKIIAPIGRFLGLMPLVKVFTTEHLVRSLTDAGFVIDFRWQPGKGKAVFIVARKPA